MYNYIPKDLGQNLFPKIIYCYWGYFFIKKSRFCFENRSIGTTKTI